MTGHQGLGRNQLDHKDTAKERKHLAHELVREYGALSSSRTASENQALRDKFHERSRQAIDKWVWAYCGTMRAQPGRSKGDDEVMLKSLFPPNWTGPFKVLRVAPCLSAPGRKSMSDKLLYLELPSRMRRVKANLRVSVMRWKPSLNPHDSDDEPRCVPAGFTEYVSV